MSLMDLQHLRSFVAVAEEGHLTRASDRLFTSQPAISAQIKALEEELGVTLFERTPRGMSLTPHGERLLDQARGILASSEDFLRQARRIRGDVLGCLRIGLNTDAEYLRVSELHALLRERHPHLELQFLPGMSSDNIAAVRVGKLDAAFISGDCPDARMSCLVLDQTRLHIAAPADWKSRLAGLDIADLAELPWVQTSPGCIHFQLVEALFKDHCCNPGSTLIADQEDALVSLVRSGAGLGILRDDELRRHSADGSLFGLPIELPRLPLQMIALRKHRDQPTLRALFDALRTVWGIEEQATDRQADQAP